MKINKKVENSFRYERKFIIPYLDKKEMLQVILANTYFFREIFYKRQVNNIYFDTFDMDSYFDNVLGNSDRTKIRIRWYGDIKEAKKPVLELKIKQGLVGTKKRYPLKAFKIGCSMDEMQRNFKESNLPEELLERMKTQRFSLVNNYKRSYFLSACGKFRVTLDSEMSYWGLLNNNSLSLLKKIENDYLVLELKYEVKEDAELVSSQFPFRMTKNSKYVTGVTYFRGE